MTHPDMFAYEVRTGRARPLLRFVKEAETELISFRVCHYLPCSSGGPGLKIAEARTSPCDKKIGRGIDVIDVEIQVQAILHDLVFRHALEVDQRELLRGRPKIEIILCRVEVSKLVSRSHNPEWGECFRISTVNTDLDQANCWRFDLFFTFHERLHCADQMRGKNHGTIAAPT